MRKFLKKQIPTKLFLLIALFYAVTLVISFIKHAYFKYHGYHYRDISWLDFFVEYFVIDYLSVMFFSVFALITTRFLIFKRIRLKYILLIHFSFSLFIGFFIYIGSTFFLFLIGKNNDSQITFLGYLNDVLRDLDVNFLVYLTMILIIYSFYYVKKIERIQVEKSGIKEQLANAKLSLLKNNLQPHFLFNTLNSISALVDINKTQAQNTIADLANLLRELLDTGNKNLITLEQELNILVKYINIIEVRFSDHFTFTSEIDDSLLGASFPSFLLQPIIENSIKHGYDYNTTDLVVDLAIEKEEDRILISISNNGKMLEDDFKLSKTNIGIKNTLERLKTIYSNDFQYYMRNKKNRKGIITHISIPLIIKKPTL